MQLTPADEHDRPATNSLRVQVDGQTVELEAGGIVRLEPGMSVCIPPRTIHQFWAEEGKGITVSAEVSSVCDDLEDNYFLDPARRFPTLIKDKPRRYHLCHEYPQI